MKLVPLVEFNKEAFYLDIVAKGGEGIMLKDVSATYSGDGRPKAMFKVKRFEEVDAFVIGGERGEEGKGWWWLIGNVDFGCHVADGTTFMVARCTNLVLEERIDASFSACCSSPLAVNHDNIDGKRTVLGTSCSKCGAVNPDPVLNPAWLGRVAAIQGQEWTVRSYRLKHAVCERWRVSGEDAKRSEECTLDLDAVKARLEAAVAE